VLLFAGTLGFLGLHVLMLVSYTLAGMDDRGAALAGRAPRHRPGPARAVAPFLMACSAGRVSRSACSAAAGSALGPACWALFLPLDLLAAGSGRSTRTGCSSPAPSASRLAGAGCREGLTASRARTYVGRGTAHGERDRRGRTATPSGSRPSPWRVAVLLSSPPSSPPAHPGGDRQRRPDTPRPARPALAVTGALLLRRAPVLRLPALLLGLGLAASTYAAASAAAAATDGRGLLGGIGAWLAAWTWAATFPALAVLLPLVFPDGRLPSPRWRPVLVTGATLVGALCLLAAVAPGRWPGSTGSTTRWASRRCSRSGARRRPCSRWRCRRSRWPGWRPWWPAGGRPTSPAAGRSAGSATAWRSRSSPPS
jgi:hypothetical protein